MSKKNQESQKEEMFEWTSMTFISRADVEEYEKSMRSNM